MKARQYNQNYVFGDGLFPRLDPASKKNKGIIKAINQGLHQAQADRKKVAEEKVGVPSKITTLPIAELNQQLLTAAQKGRLTTVRELLAQGAEINYANREGDTALILAAMSGYTEIVCELLAHGAAINHANDDGDTALIWAAVRGDTEIVNELLARGAEIDHVNNDGDTALILAAKSGRTEIVRELLARGASINHANDFDSTALTLARKNGHTAVVELIKETLAERETYPAKQKEIASLFLAHGIFRPEATELPKVLVDIIKDYARPVGLSQ